MQANEAKSQNLILAKVYSLKVICIGNFKKWLGQYKFIRSWTKLFSEVMFQEMLLPSSSLQLIRVFAEAYLY